MPTPNTHNYDLVFSYHYRPKYIWLFSAKIGGWVQYFDHFFWAKLFSPSFFTEERSHFLETQNSKNTYVQKMFFRKKYFLNLLSQKVTKFSSKKIIKKKKSGKNLGNFCPKKVLLVCLIIAPLHFNTYVFLLIL